MKWSIFLIVSVICLLLSVAVAALKTKVDNRKNSVADPLKFLLAGVVLSSVILFIPIYNTAFSTENTGLFETILMSVHNTVRLFVVDGDFEFITANLTGAAPLVAKGYTVVFAILYVAAPALTFGFVLCFFRNMISLGSYIVHYGSDVYIFSDLNEKSVLLAKSLYGDGTKNRFFVFAGVNSEDEQKSGLVDTAKKIGAACFDKDPESINFNFHSKKRELNFFLSENDESLNTSKALRIAEKFKYRENTNLYVFASQLASELILSEIYSEDDTQKKKAAIKLRRINEIQSLINRNFYEKGYAKIFSSAVQEDGIRKINAVVIGMGRYGTEMTKSLPWFCQMDGYLAEIHSFDMDPCAEKRFESICPELMKFSGVTDIDGETKYTLKIHSGINVQTDNLEKIISELPQTTYAFVALGNDEKNIAVSIKLREIFERQGIHPEIQAVVYDSDKKESLENVSNFKGQKYNIDFIGDMKSFCTEKVILGSEVETQALSRHLKWGKEQDFWQFSYNYKSSVASAIHRKMKILCGVPGADKEPSQRDEKELWGLRKLEHCRWNAYMRSEGYVYGGTVEKSGRNDLAKMHNCLVPFAELPLYEQEKDDD